MFLLPSILLIASHTHTFRCENPVPCGADGFLGDAHDAADGLVVHAHLAENEKDCEATLYTFRLEKVLWAVFGAYFFWMRQKEGKSMAL